MAKGQDSLPVATDRWGFIISASARAKCIKTPEGDMVDDPWADDLRVVEVSSVKCDDESAAAADQTFSVTTSARTRSLIRTISW